jgi:hypothetical protein
MKQGESKISTLEVEFVFYILECSGLCIFTIKYSVHLTHKQFNSSSTCSPTREYRMIYRGPGFLVVVRFGYFFTFLPPLPLVTVVRPVTHRLRKRDNLLTGGGAEEGEGAKSCVGEKTYSSSL